jgi:L-threonylcarbamoyladenylate synthase
MMLTDLAGVVAAAKAGELVCFPTDTVPALAVRPDRADLIYRLKERPESKPLIVMAAEPLVLRPYLADLGAWDGVMARYWPGALTLVLPVGDRVPAGLRVTDYLGVRVPGLAIARQILAETGPLATTSVNRSGEPALLSAEAVEGQFPELTILDPARSEPWPVGQLPSTIVQWLPIGWRLLRQGAVQPDLDWV